MNKPSFLIFGGSGFIGSHLTRYLIENNLAESVYCADLVEPDFTFDKLKYFYCDVRNKICLDIEKIDCIFNFAAVHQTPGHQPYEYFSTNILGAGNICNFARETNIARIVFTSSISPYDASEELKTEDTLPMPNSPYGISKFVAEYIHRVWLADQVDRRLVILRPGVVFGNGEGGNFTRLYKSLKSGYFAYPGRKDTKKACIYVKDIVRAAYDMYCSDERFLLFNMCFKYSPSIETIVNTISHSTGIKTSSILIPGWMLEGAANILSLFPFFANSKTGIHPDRVKKLMVSTNISGEKLNISRFALRYTLQEAIDDWYEDCEHKGLF